MEILRDGILFLLILFLYQIPFGCTKVAAGCIESESQALMEFKGSLIDPSNRLSSWVGKDCCNWDGVTCNNQTGHVEKLHLRNPIQPYEVLYSSSTVGVVYDNRDAYYNSCLKGEINPSILHLEYLHYLDLSANDFSGIQIPTFFGSWKKLRYLNLSNAGFSGEIPPHLGNLSNLEYLYVGLSTAGFSENSLTSKSLEWITGFPSLKVLDLSGTNLGQSLDWLDSINMLRSLSSLTLRDCHLVSDEVSPQLSPNLTSLVSLDIGTNYLNSTSPFRFFNLSDKLEVLKIDENDLGCPIPFMLEKLTLSILDLSGNFFSSPSLLDSLCNQSKLTYINLHGNEFEGSLPPCLGNLTSLREIYLGKNKFGGKLPNELGNLKELVALNLSDNSFNSCIPSSFGKLVNLTSLNLGGNQLHGGVPSTLGNLTRLRVLDISDNSLVGDLSESHFNKLNHLKTLSISHNQFLTLNVSSQWIPPFQLVAINMDSVQIGPRFPPWLQTQKNVLFLNMRNASISDTIPDWFGIVCYGLSVLDLSSNKIHGSLVSFPLNIMELDLSNNSLTGLFDPGYNNSVLSNLILDNNQLTGSIPDCLCNLSSLRLLSLSNNHLTGRILPCIGNLMELMVLDLSNNTLSGDIPSSLGHLEKLIFLHLNRNNLSGVVPSSLKNLRDLITLDLGENQFRGTLPEWIGQEVSNLWFLSLQSNNFHSNISIHLCQLTKLGVLNLAENNLVGQIPHCFGNLTKMQANIQMAGFFDQVSVGTYTEVLRSITKRIEREYSSNIWSFKSMSLAGNNIDGEIPNELMDLDGLRSLNLSRNKLSGRIPENIGKLKQLESLDLAMNHLSGRIPPSLANIDTLGSVNLSFNNLSGAIPPGNHFQTLMNDPSVYEGNNGLWGTPLSRSSPDDKTTKRKVNDIDDKFEILWFFAGMGPGFAFGVLGIFCFLLKNSWRHAYFGILENIFRRI